MSALPTLQSAHQIYIFLSVAIATQERCLRFLELLFASNSAPCKNIHHKTKTQSAQVIKLHTVTRNQKTAEFCLHNAPVKENPQKAWFHYLMWLKTDFWIHAGQSSLSQEAFLTNACSSAVAFLWVSLAGLWSCGLRALRMIDWDRDWDRGPCRAPSFPI